jgi:uncharacterized protein YndB with AHSA1/START domain
VETAFEKLIFHFKLLEKKPFRIEKNGRTEMAHVEHKTLIKASREDAFDYVVQPATRPEWLGSVLEVSDISEGQIGIGTSWNEKQKIAGMVFEYRCEMTEFDRPYKWAMEFTLLGIKNRLVNTFEPDSDRIRMTLIIDYVLPGKILGQLTDILLFERIFEKTCRENAGTLKMILESRASQD